MGTNLGSIITTKEISFSDLSSKKLVVDSYNMLYQFLTTIRQRDGSLLTDTKGNVTSHLSGLFFRLSKFLKEGIKPVFVFDGIAPKLKQVERERRAKLKLDAEQKYKQAVIDKDIELMKKYAGRTTRLTTEMVDEAKELISAFGIPIVQAPSEGEAQAAHMVINDDFYGMISQDTDGLLFGCPRLIKNLSISGKKRKGAVYQSINPEIVDLSENLNNLGIDRDQLIVLAILCGTDFNIGGVKGIGPKKGLALIKKHGKDFSGIFSELDWQFDYSWKKVFNTIKEMPITDEYEIEQKNMIPNKIYEILIEKHEFSEDRIKNALKEIIDNQRQTGLGQFF